MGVYNVHRRLLAGPAADVGALIDGLASADDRLWPADRWPAMRLDPGLVVAAAGGHGPIRYAVAAYIPSTWVRFTFTAPRGFRGFHEFTALAVDGAHTELRHTLAMEVRGAARLSWPFVFRPLHDSLLEDGLDRAERARTGTVTHPATWTPYVRLLRRLLR